MPILIDENIGVSPPKAPNIDNKIKNELDAANPLPTRNKLLSENGFETIVSNNSFTVYAENNVIQLKEAMIYSSKTLLEYDGFSIAVFMCKNAASLAKIYMELKEPHHNELFVFIETNDAYNRLGSFLQVKVGSDIAAKKNLPFRDILNLAKTKKYEIDEKAVLNFLNLAIYKQEKKEIFIFHLLRIIFKAKGELEKIVFTEVGEFFGIELTGWMDELRINESRWNPDHTDYPKQAMLPSSKIDELTKGVSNSEQKQEKIRDYVFSQFDTNIEGIMQKGDNILLAMSQNSIFGKSLFQKIHSQWKALSLSIANQKTKLSQKLNAFLSIIETLPDIVVAYVCGIINAIVDTISGFFELIGMICMARMYVNDAFANKEIYTSWIVETFENMLEMFDKLEMDKFMDVFFEKKDQLFRQIILAVKKASPAKINRHHFIQAAYFCGYIVGFVVSFLLEAFLTGGTAAVKDAIAFLGKGASRITRGIKDVGKQATKLFDNIHGLLSKAYREISTDAKKFFEKFKQWLDELIEAVKKKLGMASNFADIRKIADDFNQLRKEFKNANLKALWRAKVVETKLPIDELKRLFNKRIKKFPGLMNYHNQAEFRTVIKKNGQLIEDVKEYFISGDKKRLTDNFGKPPKLPDDLVDVIDDYDNFSKFASGAVDNMNRARNFDSELKYIYNFIKKHANKGDEFIVDITSLIKVCNSCSRELLMLEEYLIYRGKTIKFVIKHDATIKNFNQLLEKIK